MQTSGRGCGSRACAVILATLTFSALAQTPPTDAPIADLPAQNTAVEDTPVDDSQAIETPSVESSTVEPQNTEQPNAEPPNDETPRQPTPSESTDVPVPARVPEDEISTREVCEDDPESRAVIDRLRSRLYKITCSSASWFDGLFGDTRYVEEYRSTYGSITAGTLWSQRNSFDEILRFRAKLRLPQMNKRFHAFVGRVDRDDYVSESEPEVYGLPDRFNRGGDQTLIGVGYVETLKKRGSFDTSTGMRITFPLDPYVKGSYRYARPVGDSNLLRLRETIFWQNSEKFGMTTRIDWDRVVGKQNLLRFTGSGTFSQVSEGFRWFSNATFFHFINERRAFAYEVFAVGSTDRPVPLQDYGTFIIYRQRVWRDWLLLELRGGVDWPREFVFETRHYNLNAGVALELRFGRNTERDAVTDAPKDHIR